jgi:hypothetical protein
METVSGTLDGSLTTMTQSRRPFWFRTAFAGVAIGLILILSGDRSAYMATPGIDPLEILKLQIKPNVLIIFDTSGSMGEPFTNTPTIGGQWAFSKNARAKAALDKVLVQNQGKVNFGLESYFSQNANKRLNTGSTVYRYVSDEPGATLWTGGTGAPDGVTDFFLGAAGTPYTGNTGSNVYRSFARSTFQADLANAAACTAEPCQRFLSSRFVRTNTKFKWNTSTVPPTNTTAALDAALVSTTAIDCTAAANHAPISLFLDDPDVDADGLTDIPYACVQMEDSAATITTFWFATGTWQESGTTNCDGGALISAVAACSEDNVPVIRAALRPEMPVDGSCGNPVGVPCGTAAVDSTTGAPYTVTEGTNPATVIGLPPNTALGVIAAGPTPLGGSLNFVVTNFNTVFPNALPGGVQQNFVILVTDGVETCGGNAVTAATNLYNNNPRVYTFVIGLAISTGTLDQIARAGSGGTRDAIPAGNADTLIAALNSILDTAISTGSFSASGNAIGTVFELIQDLPFSPGPDAIPGTGDDTGTQVVESALDPNSRYNQRINILYQSTFGLPGWQGHVFAFRNDGTFLPVPNVNFTGNWDAGETLFEQVSQIMEAEVRGTGRQDNQFTFQELHNGASSGSIVNENPTGGGALIRRRIFTSNGNGKFVRDGVNDLQFDSKNVAGTNVVALWPPNQSGLSSGIANIDPPVGTVGPLDDALGIGPGSNPVLTYADLQNRLFACTASAGGVDPDTGGNIPPSPIPAGCNAVADPVLALDTARKEARQILLAWIAGARLDSGTADGLPQRSFDIPGELIYRERGWLLADSAFSQPVVVGPFLGSDPPRHVPEFILFREGRRGTDGRAVQPAELDKGFGITNPDRDEPQPAGQGDLPLKPIMTVVFVGANDGLHAFKAETSEELYSFLPYDQLGKIQDMVNPGQARTPHIFVIATSINFARIFVPDSNNFTPLGSNQTFTGRWRTVLFFGRGAGGKFLTALDVTAPGAFTRAALDTNPPWVMWNRGNPDALDPANFAKMGETWSVPGVGDFSGVSDDFRVFVGSGYGDTPEEGTTFYELNAITGDVLMAKDIADGSGTFLPDNALVASPAGFNSFLLDPPGVPLRSLDNRTSRVYIPDLHGRIWKFDTTSGDLFADLGNSQPFGWAPALLKLADAPYVFVESGDDSRVPDSAAPFRMYGFRDDGSSIPAAGDGTEIFRIDFPAPGPSNVPFRGTSQPGTLYTVDGSGIAFFLGTRFNPPGDDCISTFDTVVFGPKLDLINGGYTTGFDFSGDSVNDLSTLVQGQRGSYLSPKGGEPSVSWGGTLSSPPPPGGGIVSPTPPPPPTPPPLPIVENPLGKVTSGSPVCR